MNYGTYDMLIGFDRIQAAGGRIQLCLVGCLDKDLRSRDWNSLFADLTERARTLFVWQRVWLLELNHVALCEILSRCRKQAETAINEQAFTQRKDAWTELLPVERKHRLTENLWTCYDTARREAPRELENVLAVHINSK